MFCELNVAKHLYDIALGPLRLLLLLLLFQLLLVTVNTTTRQLVPREIRFSVKSDA